MTIRVRKVKKEITIKGLKDTVEDLLVKDGFIVPVIFVCDKEEANIMDIGESLSSDEEKDQMVRLLVDYITTKSAYKLVMVSEAWMYKAPEDMTKEQIRDIMDSGKYRHEFNKEEVYQIIEITADNISMLSRSFERKGKKIILGNAEVLSEHLDLIRFKPLQQALTMTN
jgi:hypothetical protein